MTPGSARSPAHWKCPVRVINGYSKNKNKNKKYCTLPHLARSFLSPSDLYTASFCPVVLKQKRRLYAVNAVSWFSRRGQS